MKPGDLHGNTNRILREGLMQLVKAQSYDVRVSIQRDPTIRNPYYPLFFGFLALVLDGNIVEVKREGADIQLKKVEHGIARVSYKPGYSGEILNYLIDIVSKDYLQTYLDILRKDFTNLMDTIDSQKEAVTTYLARKTPAPQSQ